MEFLEAEDVSMLDAALTIANSPIAPPLMKALAKTYLEGHDVKSPYPLPKTIVSYEAAFIRFNQYSLAPMTSIKNYTERATKVLDKTPCVVTATSVKPLGKNEDDLDARRGFLMKKNDPVDELLTNHVANILTCAYYKAAPTESNVGIPNMTLQTSIALPVLNSTVTSPVKEVKERAPANAIVSKIIDRMVAEPVSRLVYNCIASSVISPERKGIYEGKFDDRRVALVAVTASTITPAVQRVLVKHEGRLFSPVPKPFCPPALTASVSLDVAYLVAHKHREVRGEDNKHLSPLTAGYYHFSALPSTVLSLSYVTDIIGLLKKFGKSSVAFVSPFTFPVYLSLARNSYPVFILSTAVRDELEFTDDTRKFIKPKVYRVMNLSFLEENSCLVILNFMPETRPVTKKQTVEHRPDKLNDIQAVVDVYGKHLYACYVHLQKCHETLPHGYSLYPTVKPHNGSAIILNVVLDTYKFTMFSTRMVAANIYKTHFPITRIPFFLVDSATYKFTSPLIDYAIIYTSRVEPTTIMSNINLMLELDDNDMIAKVGDLPNNNFEYNFMGKELDLVPEYLKKITPVFLAPPPQQVITNGDVDAVVAMLADAQLPHDDEPPEDEIVLGLDVEGGVRMEAGAHDM